MAVAWLPQAIAVLPDQTLTLNVTVTLTLPLTAGDRGAS